MSYGIAFITSIPWMVQAQKCNKRKNRFEVVIYMMVVEKVFQEVTKRY